MDVRRDNRVVSMCGKAGLRSTLTTMLDQLQRCQKSLNEFLEVRTAKYDTATTISNWSYIFINVFVTK